ncbi:acetamidase/formamidase family protein [Dactylosporangium sp. NPDC049140]|uniref:acetamidase/formamidase family protein n=1 Tax=Dactylosporangium sp. NPDC049140 TaxID=3155647 RepID=UPI0033C22E75
MTELHEYEPKADELAYTFGGRSPVRRVRPGDVLRVYTEDCFGGRVTGIDTLPTSVVEFPFLNPVSGPFFVEGAEPGDTLALHFVSLEPARDWAVSSTFPHFGALTSTSHTATLQPPLEERVWVYELSKNIVRFSARNSDFVVDLPMDPMHGTVGVAPAAFEARMTITPDAHGGNMDTPELRAGVTVYFGVNVDGALFALGDGHARQGHGEVSGVAVECAMRTTLVVELLKGVPTPWPRLESDEFLMSTGSARPLEDAYRISQHDLVTWVGGLTGLDELDALQLVSQAGEAPVGNVCDTNYTMVAKVAKRYLRGAEAYDGVHARLRGIAVRMGL